MLNVQEYLDNHSLAQLQEDLGIKVSIDPEYPDLVCLNYDQIGSPKTHPIVVEARALILCMDTWEVESRSFDRFFNYGEAKQHTEQLDFSTVTNTEKLDGSLMNIYYSKVYDQWFVATRGTTNSRNAFTPNGRVSYIDLVMQAFGITSEEYVCGEDEYWMDIDVFDEKMAVLNDYFNEHLDPSFTYICELVSPHIVIVTQYDETQIFLLDARDKRGQYHEVNTSIFKLPETYTCNGEREVVEFVKTMSRGLDNVIEGVVLRDANGCRVKVKSPTYVKIHKAKSKEIDTNTLLEVVADFEEDEFLQYFPEYSDDVRGMVDARQKFLDEHQEKLDQAYTMLLEGNKKDVAGLFGKYASIAFLAFKNETKNIQRAFATMNMKLRIDMIRTAIQ